MLNALRLQYEAEVAKAKANIRVYMSNPAGIGEHPDLVAAVDSQIELLAHAEDKLDVLKNHYRVE
ncbi:MAG TPA: hypothetical protein EYO81_00180 [Gammaproteobacteria bacterium]|nr:hypothetical protein [Gammaproteobacteria bacterium]